jgi:hypothetical protein
MRKTWFKMLKWDEIIFITCWKKSFFCEMLFKSDLKINHACKCSNSRMWNEIK